MDEVINYLRNNSIAFLIAVGVLALLQLAFYLWPRVTYETRTGQSFWFDRWTESLAGFCGKSVRKVKWIFYFTAITALVLFFYGVYVDAHTTNQGNPWLCGGRLYIVIGLGVVSVLLAFFIALFAFLVHADKIKFTLPTRIVIPLSIFVGVIHGGYAICHRPDIPNGVLSGLLWKAFKVDIKKSDIEWLTSVDIGDIGVYVTSFFHGKAFWIAVPILIAIVAYELILRHGWIYSRPIWRRIAYPIMCVLSAAYFMSVAFAIGFVGFGYAFVVICYIISAIIAIVVGYLAICFLISGAKDALVSSSSGSYSSSGSSSYGSSSCSSSENESPDKFTAVDDQGREYYGSGDTMYRDTPGDTGTFDRHNDGTWTSRYTDEVIREKGPGD